MSTAKKILRSTLTQILGRAIMAVTSVVILKAVSNYLGVAGYGMYTAVYEYLAFFGIMADLGLFTIAVREMGKGVRDKNFVIGNILGMRMLTAVLAMCLAVVAAFLIPQYQGTYIPVGVAIASLAVFLAILQGTVSSVLQVELKMERATIGLVGGKLISMLWMLAVILYFFKGEPSADSFNQLMLAGVIGNTFSFVYTFYYALRHANIRPQFSREYWREIFLTAFPYGAALVLNMVYFRINSIMLLLMKGPVEVGLYGVPMRILEILSVIPVYFMNSVLPVLSGALQKGEMEKAKRMFQLSLEFLFMSAWPMVIGLSVLAYPIIFLIASPEFLSRVDEGFYGSDLALKILTVAMMFSFLNSLFTYSLVAMNRQHLILWVSGSAAVFNIVGNLLVIPEWGFRGAATVTVLTEILVLLVAAMIARQHVRYDFNFLPLLKSLVAGLVMGVVVYFLRDPSYNWLGMQNLNVLFLAIVGAGVYGGLLWLLGAIPKEFLKKRVG